MNEIVMLINGVADSWLAALVRICWQGSVAILLAWAICRFWPALSPRIRCWFWRLAYLKIAVLLLLGASSLELALLPAMEHALVHQRSDSPIKPAPTNTDSHGTTVQQVVANTIETEIAPTSFRHEIIVFHWQSWLMFAWLIGVGFSAVQVFRAWRRTVQLIASSRPTSDGRMSSICRAFRIRRPPAIAESDAISCPLLAGCFQSTIVLPPAGADAEARTLMFAHELAHFKRRDLLWNWLPTLVHALCYFHPLMWFAARGWQMAQESAADELALLTTQASPTRYGNMLLQAAANQGQKRMQLAGVGILESFATFKARIRTLAAVRPMSQKRTCIWGIAFIVATPLSLIPWKLVARETRPTTSANSPQLLGTAKIRTSLIDDDMADIYRQASAAEAIPAVKVSVRMLPPKAEQMMAEVTVENRSKQSIAVVAGQRSGIAGFARFEGRNPVGKPIWLMTPMVTGPLAAGEPQAVLVHLMPGQSYAEATSIHLTAPAALFPKGPEDLPHQIRCHVCLHDGQRYRSGNSEWQVIKEPRPEPAHLPAWGDAAGGLRVRIRTPQSTWPIDQDIAIYGQIENVGRSALLAPSAIAFTVDGGEPCAVVNNAFAVTELFPIEPKAGGAWFSLGLSAQKLGLIKPGRYVIRLHMSLPKDSAKAGTWVGQLTSNPIPIELAASKDASEAGAQAQEWGQTVGGLRCRWHAPPSAFAVGSRPSLQLEVQNVSDQMIVWHCASEMTWRMQPDGGSDGADGEEEVRVRNEPPSGF